MLTSHLRRNCAEWGAWRAGEAGETSPAGSSGAEPIGGGAGLALGPRGWPWQRPPDQLIKKFDTDVWGQMEESELLETLE